MADYIGDEKVKSFCRVIEGDYSEASRSLDGDYPVWPSRTVYDYSVDSLSWADSCFKHRNECRVALGLQPIPAPASPFTRANFCNLYDSTARPIFSSCLAAQSPSVRADWIRKEKEAGGNSYILSVETGYPGYGPKVNFYLEQRMPELFSVLSELLAAKLQPVLFLSSGDSYPGLYYFKGLLDALSVYSGYSRIKLVPAWEPVPGGWTTRNLYDALNFLVGLVPRERLILHLGRNRLSWSSNPVESDDPFGGDEIASCRWAAPFISEFFYQSDPFRPGDSFDTSISGSNAERAKEVADRALGLPGAPDWYAGLPRPILTAFELTAYYFIRGTGSPNYSREVASFFKGLGYQGFGNGLPL
jgi:hypothetical protein